jgi:hypothetical protein
LKNISVGIIGISACCVPIFGTGFDVRRALNVGEEWSVDRRCAEHDPRVTVKVEQMRARACGSACGCCGIAHRTWSAGCVLLRLRQPCVVTCAGGINGCASQHIRRNRVTAIEQIHCRTYGGNQIR